MDRRSSSRTCKGYLSLPSLTMMLTFLVLLMATTLLHAQEPTENVVFIIDGSLSMLKTLEDRQKIDIAKDVLIDLINELPQKRRLGLLAFGHRRSKDCSDVQELSSAYRAEPWHKAKLIEKVMSISPKGQTPLAKSIESTAGRIKNLDGKTTVVLISDGKDTCGGDPCRAVKKLRAQGIKFVMNVIGFNVTDEERKQLECIAKAGSGTYYSARSAKELKISTSKAVAKRPVQGFVKVMAKRQGKPCPANMKVYRYGETKVLIQSPTILDMKDPGLGLEPGVYHLYVVGSSDQCQQTVKIRDVKVDADKTTEKVVNLEAGCLKIRTLMNDRSSPATLSIYQEERDEKVASADTSAGNPAMIGLAPGVYYVVAWAKEIPGMSPVRLSGIAIEATQTVQKTINFTAKGFLEITTLKNKEPFPAKIVIRNSGSGREVAKGDTTVRNPESFNLVPSPYDVEVSSEKIGKGKTIKLSGVLIEAAKTIYKTVEFVDEGYLKASMLVNGQPHRACVGVYDHTTGKPITCTDASLLDSETITLPVGIYDVKLWSSTLKGRVEVTLNRLTIGPGETVEKTVSLQRPSLLVIFVLDVSGSMGGEPVAAMKQAVGAYVNVVRELGFAGYVDFACVGFSHQAHIVSEATRDYQAFVSKVNAIIAEGGTEICHGLEAALRILESNTDARGSSEIILVSDGCPSDAGPRMFELCRDIGRYGAVIHTVGVGADFGADLLLKIAGPTGGQLIPADNIAQLVPGFKKLALDSLARGACCKIGSSGDASPSQKGESLK